MRLTLHEWLLRLDWRWGYLAAFRWWLPRAVDWSCPSPNGERCPLSPTGGVEIM
jgi:hypothetical protein